MTKLLLVALSSAWAGEDAIPPDPLGDEAIPPDPLEPGAFSSAPLGRDGRREIVRESRPVERQMIKVSAPFYPRDTLARFGAGHCRSRLPPEFELGAPGTLLVGRTWLDTRSVTTIVCALTPGANDSASSFASVCVKPDRPCRVVYLHAETPGFVESTVNRFVSRRFVNDPDAGARS